MVTMVQGREAAQHKGVSNTIMHVSTHESERERERDRARARARERERESDAGYVGQPLCVVCPYSALSAAARTGILENNCWLTAPVMRCTIHNLGVIKHR